MIDDIFNQFLFVYIKRKAFIYLLLKINFNLKKRLSNFDYSELLKLAKSKEMCIGLF
jgi:hypothetical protein